MSFNFIRTIALSAAVLLFIQPAFSASTLTTNATQKDVSHLIEVWLNFQKDANNIPAIMGSIVQDQDVLWQGAVGLSNVETQQAVTTDSLTSICSITKVFTATAIMKLVDEGKLSLDDDVQQLLPEYAFEHAFVEQGPVTVRSLLTHSSGIPRDAQHGYWSAPDFAFPSTQQFLSSVSSMTTNHAVGERSGYSNVGYGLLGAIIQKASGLPYKAYMEQALLEPLEMHHSTIEMQAITHGNQHAVGYSARNRFGQRSAVNFYQTRAMQPATGLSTSISDFTKFAKWQFEQPQNEAALTLMSPSNRDSLRVNQTSSGSRGFGYQVFTDQQGEQWATHGGMCPGYNSFVKFNNTQKEAFAIFTNTNQVKALLYVNGLIEMLNTAKPILDNNSVSDSLSEYTGFYDPAPWNSQYYVSTWGDGLILMYLPSESLKHALYVYKRIEGEVFGHVVDGKFTGQEIAFLRDKQGKITSILDGGNRHPKAADH